MANTFGSSGGGFPLYDRRYTIAARRSLYRPEIPELRLANSFWVRSGFGPSIGWLLMRREEYTQINLYSTDLVLTLNDGKAELSFGGLAIVQARCVTRGKASDPDALYLIEITDHRGILANRLFQHPTIAQYNVRAPAYPEQYYTGSLNAGAAWTWDTMIGDLWGGMAAFLGAYPGLPVTPLSTPENFIFPGTGALKALIDTLDHIGCTIAVNPHSSIPYTIVSLGAADPAFEALSLQYASRLEDDLEWIDQGAARVPGLMVVYFHRRNQYYGTEETVRRDSLQWQTTPLYAITVAAPTVPIDFSSATGKGFLWDDFTVRYDVDGNPLAADVATATAIATARVTEFFSWIYSGDPGTLWRQYGGLLPFQTGSLVDGVAWHWGTFEGGEKEFVTEVMRGAEHPWPKLHSDIL